MSADKEMVTPVRCPIWSSLLLNVLGDMSSLRVLDQRLELHCKDCSREFRKAFPKSMEVQRVLHIFQTSGEFLQTVIQFKDHTGRGDKRLSLDDQIKILELANSFRPH